MTRRNWTQVHLGEIVSHRKEFIRISDTQEYMRCRVQLGAKGIVLRDRVLGFNVKTKEQQVCRSGELLVAEIDAKMGGFGIVPDDLDGAIVSSHYFLFSINDNRINRGFLGYYVRTPRFQEQVTARGSTNYAAIRPHHVLKYVIPLPDRHVQDRIVAKLDAVAAKIKEARQAKHDIEQKARAMLQSVFSELAVSSPKRMLGEFLTRVKHVVTIDPLTTYKEVTVRLWGKGVVLRREVSGLDIAGSKRFRAQSGQFIMSRIDARNGAFGLIPKGLDGAIVTNDFPVFNINADIMLPEVFGWMTRTSEFARLCHEASEGTTNRVRLKEDKFLSFGVPIPTYEAQLWFNRLLAKTREVVSAQQQTEIELDAMFPSVLDKAFKGEL